jgi:5,10-methylenetetrahydromethanopterin reductase
VIYHGIWAGEPEAVDAMPGGAAWRTRIESERPEGQRHLAVHEGHCTHVVGRDETIFDALGENVAWAGWVGSAEDVRKRAEASSAAGVTEILYTPAGADLERDTRAFYEAVAPLKS